MRRAGLVLLLAGHAHASPNRGVVDVSEEIGVASATHTTVTCAYARRFASERFYGELRLGFGTTGTLLVVEERGGVGIVFRRGERIEVSLGWRVGHTHLRGEINELPFTVNVLALEAAAVIAVGLGEKWRLRASPAVPTLFWNRTYAGSIGLELGAEYAF